MSSSSPTAQSMNRGDFSEEELREEQWAKNFDWDHRPRPTEYNPIQLDEKLTIPVRCIEWWNTRSPLFCCCFPCAGALSNHKTFDGTDPSIWKEVLADANPKIPESMRGVWWLKDNHAHEQLVTIFNHAELTGTFNEDGTDGYGKWERTLEFNWSRDKTCFGYILGIAAKKTQNTVKGRMNLKDGILTVHAGRGQGAQLVYKVNDDEWWKIHYMANPGEEGSQNFDFMYKWLKVIDKDGATTQHWNEYVEWTNKPTPHENCCAPACPIWPLFSCLSKKQVGDIMRLPNKKQIVRFL